MTNFGKNIVKGFNGEFERVFVRELKREVFVSQKAMEEALCWVQRRGIVSDVRDFKVSQKRIYGLRGLLAS